MRVVAIHFQLPGTIYLKQTLQFHSPVPADTQVEGTE